MSGTKVGLVIVAYNSGKDLAQLIDSAFYGHELNVHLELFLHSNHEPTVACCHKVASVAYRDHVVEFHDLRYNAGLARSWNTGILRAYEAGCERVVVCNDDVLFIDRDFSILVNASLVKGDDHFITTCSGYHVGYDKRVESHGFSCFVLNPLALQTVGCFDENFHPAYFEDTDYWRRAMLLGQREYICKSTNVRHIGSATIQRDAEVNRANATWFHNNGKYYMRKWGGLPDHETYERAFDKFGLRIDPADRAHPYGHPYDRDDKADNKAITAVPMFA